ncbi:hypothetical protein ACH0BF_04685 [Pseudobacillus sp. 179-B 2D1 NHS]|uniref:hypothetical protein n=1 Tax=Pseudobacillus sp. 179-B 2D1 NHS TaxID=3374292 RepID=UPI000E7620EA|nr:hypothetical protein CJ483_11970 [Bacillus sp. PK3_68]
MLTDRKEEQEVRCPAWGHVEEPLVKLRQRAKPPCELAGIVTNFLRKSTDKRYTANEYMTLYPGE